MVKFGPLPDIRRQLCLHSVLWVTWLNIIQAAPAPQAEPITIVAFGDSTTAERGATKVYAKILQEELQNVRVVNAGVCGNTAEIGRSVLEHIAGDGQHDVRAGGDEVVARGKELLHIRLLDVPDLGRLGRGSAVRSRFS
jgi:hypothetical protein